MQGPGTVPFLAAILMVGLQAAPGHAQVQVAGTSSRPDASGAYTVSLDLEPGMPVVVQPGQTWEALYTYRLPPHRRIRRVRSFLGVDRGNVFEGHVLVLAGDYYIHTRGPHKEALATYDAWAAEPANYRSGQAGADVNVYALCRPTSQRPIACHLGVILEVAP